MLRQVGYKLLRYAPLAALTIALLSLLALDSEALRVLEPRWTVLGVSLLLLCSVFALRGLIWGRLLRRFGFGVSVSLALASANRSLLLKYLPGKIWVMLGRAGYVHAATRYPLLPMSAVSLLLQLLTVTVGALIGLIGLMLLCCKTLSLPAILLSAGFLWYLARPRTLPARMVRRLPNSRLRVFLQGAPLPAIADIVIAVAGQWLLMGVAYWLFFAGCSVDVSWLAALLQPGANATGIVAVFAPGGIGIREGAATAYLVQLGVSLPLALAIGLAARVWFMLAEFLMFAMSYLDTSSGTTQPRESQEASP